MQCFLFPVTLCRELENLMCKFWWRNAKTGKGIHWCRWCMLCSPKAQGGLGFRELNLFNKALLANISPGGGLYECTFGNLPIIYLAEYLGSTQSYRGRDGLEDRAHMDETVWRRDRTGEYTAHSGYRWLVTRGYEIMGTNITPQNENLTNFNMRLWN
ncbi:RNA-directed DNA polymerase reverse transcriptase family protein [Gossypium australe]|uniref:RNA-directed DNA polymerase reverse transcriptase family protein n=1 Tax=Gossypium australe TaxID=47621 RepID=A0A5B6VZQ1_9ROSI|nr:RNA-directed DNA polymerase reverse transcriptase family protein [Gossypium australe]